MRFAGARADVSLLVDMESNARAPSEPVVLIVARHRFDVAEQRRQRGFVDFSEARQGIVQNKSLECALVPQVDVPEISATNAATEFTGNIRFGPNVRNPVR